MSEKKSRTFRYSTSLTQSLLTPLADVSAYIGTEKLNVLNISAGGIALAPPQEHSFGLGDVIDISVEIHGRGFPVKVEVKGKREDRLSCAFDQPSVAFQSALREFIRPKFLALSLTLKEEFSDHPEVLALMPEAQKCRVFSGQNQVAVFVWLRDDLELLKIFSSHRDLVAQWTPGEGFKTGHVDEDNDPVWDRNPQTVVLNYFADIALNWIPSPEGEAFVEAMLSSGLNNDKIYFPKILL